MIAINNYQLSQTRVHLAHCLPFPYAYTQFWITKPSFPHLHRKWPGLPNAGMANVSNARNMKPSEMLNIQHAEC